MLLRGMLFGIAIAVAVVLAVGAAAVNMGYMPMQADMAPMPFEADIAMKAVHAVSERQMGEVRNPLVVNEANLAAGLHIYTQNCAMCHGSADGKASNASLGFYVPSPQFAADGAEDDPEGATAWKIRHGIRYTAMPAFVKSLSEEQIWQVTMLIKHMDQLPPAIAIAWKNVPSAAAVGSHAATTHTAGMVMH